MRKFVQVLPLVLIAIACSTSRTPVEVAPDHITSNPNGQGPRLEIEMVRGEGHNHPLMAIWIEDESGEYIQTLYVAESIGKGIFQHGDASKGFWMPGEIRRPAALPYWSHRRGIKAEDGLDKTGLRTFKVLFEINQTWDWNEFWTNNKFSEDDEYKTSCQPAVVYAAMIDLDNPREECVMEVIGRSHHSGANGELYNDLQTITTALHIADKITIRIVE